MMQWLRANQIENSVLLDVATVAARLGQYELVQFLGTNPDEDFVFNVGYRALRHGDKPDLGRYNCNFRLH